MANRTRRGGKTIDTVHWTLGTGGALAQGAGTMAALMVAAQHLPETLLRIRGEVIVFADGTPVTGRLARISMGIIQVPEGTGATVLWSPETDADAPWIWWYCAHIGYEEMVTDVIDAPGITSARVVIDSKAMRKLRNTEIQFVTENVTVNGAISVNVSASVRILAGS